MKLECLFNRFSLTRTCHNWKLEQPLGGIINGHAKWVTTNMLCTYVYAIRMASAPADPKRTPLSSQGTAPLSHLLAIQSGGGFQGQRQMRGSV